jgi:hypothetical protein
MKRNKKDNYRHQMTNAAIDVATIEASPRNGNTIDAHPAARPATHRNSHPVSNKRHITDSPHTQPP